MDSFSVSQRLTGLEALFTVERVPIALSRWMHAGGSRLFPPKRNTSLSSIHAVIGIHVANALSIVYNTSINPLSRIAACNRKKIPRGNISK
jgi:hypothetical protein